MKDNIDLKILEEILKSREDRAQKQRELLDKYSSSLISFTLNTPGSVKSSELYRRIHAEGMDSLIKLLKEHDARILYQEANNKSTGSEGYILVDMDALELKGLMISLESTHPLGRIFDIDIFDKNQKQISRSDISEEPRKCLICNKDARICMREKNHSYEELITRIEEVSRKYFETIKAKA